MPGSKENYSKDFQEKVWVNVLVVVTDARVTRSFRKKMFLSITLLLLLLMLLLLILFLFLVPLHLVVLHYFHVFIFLCTNFYHSFKMPQNHFHLHSVHVKQIMIFLLIWLNKSRIYQALSQLYRGKSLMFHIENNLLALRFIPNQDSNSKKFSIFAFITCFT